MHRRNTENSIRKLALIELARILKNVSKACEIVGFSRDTYYRVSKAPILKPAAEDSSRKSRRYSAKTLQARKELERIVLETARKNPGLGKRSLARIIQERGVYISSSGVYNILKKNPPDAALEPAVLSDLKKTA